MSEWDWVYERVLDSKLSFSLHGLRHRLPEAERPYWEEYIGKPVTIDDEYKSGLLLIQPRRVSNLTNVCGVAVVQEGYAWLQNVYETVSRTEEEFCEHYCKAKGWSCGINYFERFPWPIHTAKTRAIITAGKWNRLSWEKMSISYTSIFSEAPSIVRT